jgi:hypothetical protein
MPPAEVRRGSGERIVAVCGECEMSLTEGIDEVGTLERRCGLLGSIVFSSEGATREEANCLGYGGLKEATELRMRRTVCRKNLAEREKGR